MDLERIKQALAKVTELGIEQHDLAQKARHLCFGMSRDEQIAAALKHLTETENRPRLEYFLKLAEERKLDCDEVDGACFLLEHGGRAKKGLTVAPPPPPPEEEEEESGAPSVSPIEKAYAEFLAMKDKFPLGEFPRLRREGNFAKRQYLTKRWVKAQRLIWQKSDIPRSLIKLSTEYCGGAAKSKQVKKQAPVIFKNILRYMGDAYHQYPTTLVLEIIRTGRSEPLLRDEIFAQLIKQTTRNPRKESMLRGFKLLYICISSFPPSPDFKPYIVSHLASHAHQTFPSDALGFNDVADLATNCYFMLEDVCRLPAGQLPVAPVQYDIDRITQGTYQSMKLWEAVAESRVHAMTVINKTAITVTKTGKGLLELEAPGQKQAGASLGYHLANPAEEFKELQGQAAKKRRKEKEKEKARKKREEEEEEDLPPPPAPEEEEDLPPPPPEDE